MLFKYFEILMWLVYGSTEVKIHCVKCKKKKVFIILIKDNAAVIMKLIICMNNAPLLRMFRGI